jgi:hypothetical protein
MSKPRLSRRRIVLGSLMLFALATVGGTALAGHLPSGVKSYTGCLVPKDGGDPGAATGREPGGGVGVAD